MLRSLKSFFFFLLPPLGLCSKPLPVLFLQYRSRLTVVSLVSGLVITQAFLHTCVQVIFLGTEC